MRSQRHTVLVVERGHNLRSVHAVFPGWVHKRLREEAHSVTVVTVSCEPDGAHTMNCEEPTLPADFLRPKVTDPAFDDTRSLNVLSETGLMKQIGDPESLVRAWSRVELNRGAPATILRFVRSYSLLR
jgi:hypothetical protein